MDAGRSVLPGKTGTVGHRPPESSAQHFTTIGIHARGNPGCDGLLLRHHDGGRRPASQIRTFGHFRLRQPVRALGAAVYPRLRAYPNDGSRPAVYQRSDQQDHQYAQRRVHRRRQGRLHDRLDFHAESGGSLSGRIKAQPTAEYHQRLGRLLFHNGASGGDSQGSRLPCAGPVSGQTAPTPHAAQWLYAKSHCGRP